MPRFEPLPGRLPNWIDEHATQPLAAVWHTELGSAHAHSTQANTSCVPRSALADAHAALACAQRDHAAWRELDAHARHTALACWIAALSRDELVPAAAALALGLDAREAALLAELEHARARRVLAAPPFAHAGESRAEPHVARAEPARSMWYAPHWSELGALMVRDMALRLARGDALIVAADARWPHAAHACASAWRRCGLPGGIVQVLHGIEWLDRARAWPRELGQACVVRAPREELEARAHASELAHVEPLAVVCEQLCGSDARSGDFTARIETLLCGAFGRVRALGGRHARRIALARVDAHVYAEVVERMRARLESGAACGERLAALHASFDPRGERAAARELEIAQRLRDLGATPVRARADGPVLYVNATPTLRELERVPAGAWLCIARDTSARTAARMDVHVDAQVDAHVDAHVARDMHGDSGNTS